MRLVSLNIITLSRRGKEATIYPSTIRPHVLIKSICLQNIKSFALISNMSGPKY